MKVKKSRNFDANLDAERMVRQITENIKTTVEEAKNSANLIAPFDTGRLRESATVKVEGIKGYVEWPVPYAERVYKTNRKNPHTTEWAKKDIERNSKQRTNTMNKGVIK